MQNRQRKQRRCRGGFTLLEVLLVIAILGAIAAMVVPNLIGRQQESMINTTKLSIDGFEKAVSLYAVQHDGLYPEGDSETVIEVLMSNVDEKTGKPCAPFLDTIPLDAWQNPLMYEYPPTGDRQTVGMKPAIWSMGPDQQDGTDMDITNWEQENL